jgi:hypothetical protein
VLLRGTKAHANGDAVPDWRGHFLRRTANKTSAGTRDYRKKFTEGLRKPLLLDCEPRRSTKATEAGLTQSFASAYS